MKISATELQLTYPGASRPALAGVSTEIASGSFQAVIGPNGSGKSTLMKALLGILPLQSGTVLLGDRALPEWSRREMALRIGAVSQTEPLPFPLTVKELVGMGRYARLGPLQSEGAEDRAAVMDALERCDAAALADRRVQTLSGGELQRVRIARALAQQPEALLLDEPTASLDVRHEMGILELLRGAADCGITVVWITHHLDQAARFADRLLLLDEGHVRADGPPDEVMNEETLRRVYGWPIAVRPDPLTGTPRITALGDAHGRSRHSSHPGDHPSIPRNQTPSPMQDPE